MELASGVTLVLSVYATNPHPTFPFLGIYIHIPLLLSVLISKIIISNNYLINHILAICVAIGISFLY